jgi:hypothetical protein
MARQYRFFQRHNGAMQLRYEDLQSQWDAAVAQVAARFYPRLVRPLVAAARQCDTSSWSSEKLASSNHVTAGKHAEADRCRLQGLLAAKPEVRRHLCALCAALEYGCQRWCPTARSFGSSSKAEARLC